MNFTSVQIRYLLKLIADNTDGWGYANVDEVLEDDSAIGSLQTKLSIMLQAAEEAERRRA